MAKLPVDDTDKFQTWLLEEFQDNGETVMFAPGEGFYGTPGKGRDEVRLAYILKQAKVQKKNPWKEEIFVDTKDYQEAMARTR